MRIPTAETDAANEAVARILADLGLAGSRFVLEPQGDSWRLRVQGRQESAAVECEVMVEHHHLYASLDDRATYERLRHEWSVALAGCTAR